MTIHTKLCDLLGVTHPIMLAGMGGVSYAELVAAVSNAGGYGVLGMAGRSPDFIRDEMRKVRKLTDKPFGVDLLAATPESLTASVDIIIGEGASAFVAGLGVPMPIMARLKGAGLKVMVVCGAVKHAVKAEQAGCDVGSAESDEFLIGIDVVAVPSAEGSGGPDRLGQRKKDDAERARDQEDDVADGDPRDTRHWDARRHIADDRHALGRQVERGGQDDPDDERHEGSRDLRGDLLQDDDPDKGADSEYRRVDVHVVELLGDLDELLDDGSAHRRDPEQGRDLADGDDDGKPDDEPGHDRGRQELRQEPQAHRARDDQDGTDRERQAGTQHDVVAGDLGPGDRPDDRRGHDRDR